MQIHFKNRSAGNQIPMENLQDIVNAVVNISQELNQIRNRFDELEKRLKSLETIPEPGNVRME